MRDRFAFRWAKLPPSSSAVGPLFCGAFMLGDAKCAAFYTEKPRHASAHHHALCVIIVCSLQHCFWVGAAGPLAIAPQGPPRPFPSQTFRRSLYQGSLDGDLAAPAPDP